MIQYLLETKSPQCPSLTHSSDERETANKCFITSVTLNESDILACVY